MDTHAGGQLCSRHVSQIPFAFVQRKHLLIIWGMFNLLCDPTGRSWQSVRERFLKHLRTRVAKRTAKINGGHYMSIVCTVTRCYSISAIAANI